MTDFNFAILYVADVARSQAFYTNLLGRPPIEASPSFAMFKAAPGMMLGLWNADEVEPKAKPGGSELCIPAPQAEIDGMAAAWAEKGIEIALEPKTMDFGYTFVGLDPDGHRVRVFAPAG